MSRVIAVIAVFEEEQMLPAALESFQRGSGVDEIHVFDGAWKNFADDRFSSGDKTQEVVRSYSDAPTPAIWHPARRMWGGQELKRTAMFHSVGATETDYILIFDADERFEGSMPALEYRAYCLMNRCVGGNDLPGIRGNWPAGDYSEEYIPAIRLFAWNPTLRCLWPGGYEVDGELIKVYVESKSAHGGWTSIIPIIEGASFTHHGAERNEIKMEQKLAYYTREHPERKKRQNDYINNLD